MRILLFIFLCARCFGGDLFFSLAGNDTTGNGSSGTPYRTIGKCASVANPGDNIRRTGSAGLFDERISIARAGSAGSFINFIGSGDTICRGFDVSGASYVRIINFNITHTNTTYNNGVTFSGTCVHVELIDNYIHGIFATGGSITCAGGTTLSYPVYRGNQIEDNNIVNGTVVNDPTVGISTMPNATDHALIEYNVIRRVGDFVYMHGDHDVARNNAIYQYTNAYWNFTPGVSFHIDGFQGGSDGVATGSHDQDFQNNWHGENRGDENHAGIWQNTVVSTDANILYRGNVNYLVGAGGIANISTDDYYVYHNTFSEIGLDLAGAGNGAVINARSVGGDIPANGLVANTLIYDNGSRAGAIDVTDTTGYAKTHNAGYLAGTDASYSVTTDPLFVDRPNKDFRLQSGSPERGAGAAITTVTSSTGSGTSFAVGNAKLFRDGYTIVDGDSIRVGSTNATMVRVTSISANTLTVSSSISWVNGDAVYWGDHGLDIGALPYFATPLTAATISNSGTTYTVTPNGDARGVWFYVDGIPTTWVSTSPFTATIASGTVTAKAYALYAQATPVIAATSGGEVGGVAQLKPHGTLRGNTTLKQ